MVSSFGFVEGPQLDWWEGGEKTILHYHNSRITSFLAEDDSRNIRFDSTPRLDCVVPSITWNQQFSFPLIHQEKNNRKRTHNFSPRNCHFSLS
jgi:hypothetical protein